MLLIQNNTASDLKDSLMTDSELFDDDFWEMMSEDTYDVTTDLTVLQAYEEDLIQENEQTNIYAEASRVSLAAANKKLDEINVKLDKMISRQMAYKAYTIKISRYSFKCI